MCRPVRRLSSHKHVTDFLSKNLNQCSIQVSLIYEQCVTLK